jgi:flagellar basal-body rod modification protein FlgD
MAAITPLTGADVAPATQTGSVQQTATNAFGLGFEDLLRIVLTQLTYQDPLKPVDNFEFVSQLAQFSQIQQTQTMSDRVLGLLQAQATNQATSVLGHFVDIPSGAAQITGKVTSVSFQSGEPQLTIETRDGRTLSGIALTSVSRIGLDQ